MHKKQVVAQVVQALYSLNRLDEVLDSVREPANEFVFPSKDFLATMRLVPGMQSASRAAVIMNFAGDVGKVEAPASDKPLFDAELEQDNPFEEMGPAREFTPKTREQIQKDDAAVSRVCESAANIDVDGRGRNWLRVMTRPVDVFNQETKMWHREWADTHIVLPFEQWHLQQLRENPVRDELHRVNPGAAENVWPFALLYARQAGANVPYWDSYKVDQHDHNLETPGAHLGASDAMEYVRDGWLKETVFAREFQREMPRLERLVTRAANRAWLKLQEELLKRSPDELIVVRLLDNTLLNNSPMMTDMIGMMKNDAFFKREVAVARLDKAIAARTALHMKVYPKQVLDGTFKLPQAEVDLLPFEVQAAIIEAKVMVETKRVLAELEAIVPAAAPQPQVETPAEAAKPNGGNGLPTVYGPGMTPIVRRQQ